MHRGEIYWADLSPRSGSEQKGRRPVLVVSRDALNQIESWRSINVVPLSTSTAQARRGLTVATFQAGTAGLDRDTSALCHQITTLDRSKLISLIGTLPDADLARVEVALKIALELD